MVPSWGWENTVQAPGLPDRHQARVCLQEHKNAVQRWLGNVAQYCFKPTARMYRNINSTQVIGLRTRPDWLRFHAGKAGLIPITLQFYFTASHDATMVKFSRRADTISVGAGLVVFANYGQNERRDSWLREWMGRTTVLKLMAIQYTSSVASQEEWGRCQAPCCCPGPCQDVRRDEMRALSVTLLRGMEALCCQLTALQHTGKQTGEMCSVFPSPAQPSPAQPLSSLRPVSWFLLQGEAPWI